MFSLGVAAFGNKEQSEVVQRMDDFSVGARLLLDFSRLSLGGCGPCRENVFAPHMRGRPRHCLRSASWVPR
jgi:hypothetical protein